MFTNFEKAVFFAVEGRDLEDDCDNLVSHVVETHEPVENFRPVDVMSGKPAGREYTTPHGVVVIRRNMQRNQGSARQDMYIMQGEGSTLIGWRF